MVALGISASNGTIQELRAPSILYYRVSTESGLDLGGEVHVFAVSWCVFRKEKDTLPLCRRMGRGYGGIDVYCLSLGGIYIGVQ